MMTTTAMMTMEKTETFELIDFFFSTFLEFALFIYLMQI